MAIIITVSNYFRPMFIDSINVFDNLSSVITSKTLSYDSKLTQKITLLYITR